MMGRQSPSSGCPQNRHLQHADGHPPDSDFGDTEEQRRELSGTQDYVMMAAAVEDAQATRPLPYIVVEPCMQHSGDCFQTTSGNAPLFGSSLCVPAGGLKKIRNHSDSVLYIMEREAKRQVPSSRHLSLYHVPSSVTPVTDWSAREQDALYVARECLVTGKLDMDAEGKSKSSWTMAEKQQAACTSDKRASGTEYPYTTETAAMDLSQKGRRMRHNSEGTTDMEHLTGTHDKESVRGEEYGDQSKEDSMLLTKRLKLKRYLQDRYQLGLDSSSLEGGSERELHSDSEVPLLATQETAAFSELRRQQSDEQAQWLEYRVMPLMRPRAVPPLEIIKNETGSEPPTPNVFASPTMSTMSYSPVFGSPHSSVDSPQYAVGSQQGSFFHFHVPSQSHVSNASAVNDWVMEGQQGVRLARFPTVSEYPLNQRLAAQYRLEGGGNAPYFPHSAASSSMNRHRLWRSMTAPSSHHSDSTPSPFSSKSRFLFQPEMFSHHLRLTESPPRSPFSGSGSPSAMQQRHGISHLASSPGGIPSASLSSFSQASMPASHAVPSYFSVPVSPHETTSSFACPVCHEVQPSYGSLADHMVIHVSPEGKAVGEGSKVYVCKGCKRSFSRSDMLTRHMRLHTGLKPYECAICGQVFSRSDHLHTHLRTHTGEKPYHCAMCSYAAPRRDMITRHMRVHGKRSPGSSRGRSLSSSSCSDVAAAPLMHENVKELRKHSLSSGESPESSDQSVRESAAGSPTGRSQFWYGKYAGGPESRLCTGSGYESMESEPSSTEYASKAENIASASGWTGSLAASSWIISRPECLPSETGLFTDSSSSLPCDIDQKRMEVAAEHSQTNAVD